MVQSVDCVTSAQVMILQFMSSSLTSSPTSGSMLIAQSPEPASDSVSSSLSALPPLTLCLSLSLSKINVKKNFLKDFAVKALLHFKFYTYFVIILLIILCPTMVA